MDSIARTDRLSFQINALWSTGYIGKTNGGGGALVSDEQKKHSLLTTLHCSVAHLNTVTLNFAHIAPSDTLYTYRPRSTASYTICR